MNISSQSIGTITNKGKKEKQKQQTRKDGSQGEHIYFSWIHGWTQMNGWEWMAQGKGYQTKGKEQQHKGARWTVEPWTVFCSGKGGIYRVSYLTLVYTPNNDKRVLPRECGRIASKKKSEKDFPKGFLERPNAGQLR